MILSDFSFEQTEYEQSDYADTSAHEELLMPSCNGKPGKNGTAMDEGVLCASKATSNCNPSPSQNKFNVSPAWVRSVLDLAREAENKCACLQEIVRGHPKQRGLNNRGKRSQRSTPLEQYLRKHVQESLGIDVHGPVGRWPHPERSSVVFFNENRPGARGPHMFNLGIDWFYSGKTPWTEGCIQILAEKFLSQYCVGDFDRIRQRLTFSEVAKVLERYLLHLKARYHREAKGFVQLMEVHP